MIINNSILAKIIFTEHIIYKNDTRIIHRPIVYTWLVNMSGRNV